LLRQFEQLQQLQQFEQLQQLNQSLGAGSFTSPSTPGASHGAAPRMSNPRVMSRACGGCQRADHVENRWSGAAVKQQQPPIFRILGEARAVRLNFSLVLADELYGELKEACQESQCSPKQFAAQLVESALASRRLPNVAQGSYGARIALPGADEEAEAELTPCHILWPEIF
jgi:hypothetical protein